MGRIEQIGVEFSRHLESEWTQTHAQAEWIAGFSAVGAARALEAEVKHDPASRGT